MKEGKRKRTKEFDLKQNEFVLSEGTCQLCFGIKGKSCICDKLVPPIDTSVLFPGESICRVCDPPVLLKTPEEAHEHMNEHRQFKL